MESLRPRATESIDPVPGEVASEPIRLRRLTRETLGDCVHCGSLGGDPRKKDLVLCIEFESCYLSLCPYCESELLSALLANWLRRKRREGSGRKKTKLPDIFKFEDSDEEEVEDIDSWYGVGHEAEDNASS